MKHDRHLKSIEMLMAIPAIAHKQNFDLNKTNEIHCHSWKEHVEISKITKFGCELLQNEENITL
jgi:hypothetical protein